MFESTIIDKCKVVGITILVFLMLVIFSGNSYSGEASERYTVFGQDFWTETVDNEPGNYWVHLGSEQMKWEPKPWQPDELREVGPIFYPRLNKKLGEEKNYFPYKVTVGEREKMTAKEFWDVFYPNNIIPTIADENGSHYQDEWYGELRSPDDKKKLGSGGYEYIRGYRKSVEFPEGAPMWKYLFFQTYPEESSGLGILQIVYSGTKVDDNFLYVPAVRKVRRLASSNRQDYLARMVIRQEDNALCKPVHNYDFTGKELMKDPGPEYPGYALGRRNPDIKFRGGDHRYCDGIGEPCQIMEITPYRKDWWFGKMIKKVGIFSGEFWHEEAYDQKGRLVRQFALHCGLMYLPGEGKDIKGSVPLPHFDSIPSLDLTTGYMSNLYAIKADYLQKDIPPDDIFVENSLLKEVSEVNWYK